MNFLTVTLLNLLFPPPEQPSDSREEINAIRESNVPFADFSNALDAYAAMLDQLPD